MKISCSKKTDEHHKEHHDNHPNYHDECNIHYAIANKIVYLYLNVCEYLPLPCDWWNNVIPF